MNFKKIILASALVLGGLCASAQQPTEVYVFNPHWYGQIQVGGQETLGEGAFDKLLSPNAQIAVGYQINPLFGLRLGVNCWQSKGAIEFPSDNMDYWKWKYVAPALDVTFNLTNAFGGYNPTRLVDLNLFAGVGCNIGFDNKEANQLYNRYHPAYSDYLVYNWEGTKARPVGRFGLDLDFRVSDAVKIGVEFASNILSDKYNSKKAGNADWYFNGLVGIKWNFGPSYTKKTVEPVVPVEPIVQTIVTRDTVYIQPAPVVKEVVKEVVAAPVPEGIERNVFYTINKSVISNTEMQKVIEVADFMKAHPGSTVHITGYADKGTGTLAINVRLARERAMAVVNALVNKYGISRDRITWSSMTDHEFQPFPNDPVKNRVAICVVE